MTITLNVPAYANHAQTPAQQWLANPATELGFTTPRLNGHDAIFQYGAFGAAPQCALNTATVAITPQSDDFVGRVTAAPVNTFDWQVTVPPPGPWTAAATVDQLLAVVAQIRLEDAARPVFYDQIRKYLNGTGRTHQWVLDVEGRGCTLAAIRTHTITHETQHVLDHIHVIRTILGPWDAWVSQVGRTYTDDSSPAVTLYFDSANGYVPHSGRLLRKLLIEIDRSGTLYHHTVNGAPCSRQVEGFDTMADGKKRLRVSVRPKGAILAGAPMAAIPAGPIATSWFWPDENDAARKWDV